MSGIADRIRIAQDKDGMLRRALERIIQLYTDKSHFVYELLQNAEDAGATSIKFVQYCDRLEVLHDGKPFTAENLQGLCDIGRSDKADNLNQIGEFGVGFKSVFGICDTVKLFSDPSHYHGSEKIDAVPFAVEILDFTRPEDIPEMSIESSYTTKFVFPYTIGQSFSGFSTIDELKRVLSKKLQNLGITTLLFMKHLELIEYQIKLEDATVEGQYLLEKVTVNDHCTLVSALGVSHPAGTQGSQDESVSYLKFSRPVGKELLRSVDIAFPVIIDESGRYECQKPQSPYVSVYFPTETESKLDFIVQGPYRTTPNRSSIPSEDADNKILARQTAMLLKDSIHEIKTSGILNMSFLKALPLSAGRFENFSLFYPIFEAVKELFLSQELIPCKDGGYVAAKYARIARQERLANTMPDNMLTELIADGHQYHWLPTFLTETNREYEQVYRFLNGELKISVIRPEDLRLYFAANPDFLPRRDDAWLVELYSILENVGAAFSKSRNETNMLTADIVKTSAGLFVAPYRKTEGKQYIPNVFLPTGKIRSADIHFVDAGLYQKCKHFFDDILQLQAPNEYEFTIKDIKRRYESSYTLEEGRHIEDIKSLLKYSKYDDYHDEVVRLIEQYLVLRCADGVMRSAYRENIFLPINDNGINIEAYYKNVRNTMRYVDADFYALHEISPSSLCELGIRDSIVIGDTRTGGTYDNGMRGRQPEWWTTGEFRWKFSLDAIRDVLKYISGHPSAKDSLLKSQAIFRILLQNEAALKGTVYIGGSTPHLHDEPCDLVKVLRGEGMPGWDGKWLFTESGELISQKSVSKHDISTSIYGRIKPDSTIYDMLGFRKTDADEIDELKKTIPQRQLDAFFENELKQRFGISSAELSSVYVPINGLREKDIETEKYAFPVVKVKNWDALRKHAAEMLCYASPVKYEYLVRSVRTSKPESEVRAYLMNMYRYDSMFKYACQICHEATSTIVATQLFEKPEVELDPMNLCLCPTCASHYRALRNDKGLMDDLRERLVAFREPGSTDADQVIVTIGEDELWFTQTHFAEIQELLKLTDDVKNGASPKGVKDANRTKASTSDSDDESKSGLSVYQEYIGKRVRHKGAKITGKVVACDGQYISILAETGEKAGNTIKYDLSMCIKGKHLELAD
jgi:hypothetical protein